jgi:hypothetical protein
VALTLGCRGEILEQPLLSEPPNFPPGQSNGASPLIGAWVATDSTSSDSVVVTQTVTTRWRFSSDNTCSYQQTTVLTPPGSTQTVSRTCTYVDRGATVSITYDDNTTEDLPYSVPSGNSNQLVLGSVTYDRSS